MSNTQHSKEEQKKPVEKFFAATDPHKLAAAFRKAHGRDSHNHPALRFWRGEFWNFRDGRYWRLGHHEIKAQVTQFIADKFSREKPASKGGQIFSVGTALVNSTLQALSGSTLVPSEAEQPVWLHERQEGPFLSFENGLVPYGDITTGPQTKQFWVGGPQTHCSLWFNQQAFPYEYDEKAECPRWLQFLEEVLEGDADRIALLQEWFGYCLTPDTSQQKFVVMVGEGANGKSVVLDALTAMLGTENVSHVPIEAFGERFQATMTLGKLANISPDTGAIKESAEATIKEFTAGDRMYFDRKGVSGVMAYPTARLIVATNHDPRFADRSRGIWRRMIVIPFQVTIPAERQDRRLASKLKDEVAGILNWAIEGLKRLRTQGHFTVAAACAKALAELRLESNPAIEFLGDHYEEAGNADSVLCSVLYGNYQSWCGERGVKPLDSTNFGKEVKKLFPKVERGRESKGGRRYFYAGLRDIPTVPAPDICEVLSDTHGEGNGRA